MTSFSIAVIAGDGIGTEVMPQGVRVLEAAARRLDLHLRLDHFEFASCAYYQKHGEMMPANWKEIVGGHDAIFSALWAGPPPCLIMCHSGVRC